jgi:hypothetical protein
MCLSPKNPRATLIIIKYLKKANLGGSAKRAEKRTTTAHARSVLYDVMPPTSDPIDALIIVLVAFSSRTNVFVASVYVLS